MEVVNAIGRRKAAIARVYVSEGNGKITVNRRELSDYFPSPILQFVVKQPLNVLNVDGQYDIKAESKPALKAEGFVTRDPRAVERKKPGRPKARKRFQFSKR